MHAADRPDDNDQLERLRDALHKIGLDVDRQKQQIHRPHTADQREEKRAAEQHAQHFGRLSTVLPCEDADPKLDKFFNVEPCKRGEDKTVTKTKGTGEQDS